MRKIIKRITSNITHIPTSRLHIELNAYQKTPKKERRALRATEEEFIKQWSVEKLREPIEGYDFLFGVHAQDTLFIVGKEKGSNQVETLIANNPRGWENVDKQKYKLLLRQSALSYKQSKKIVSVYQGITLTREDWTHDRNHIETLAEKEYQRLDKLCPFIKNIDTRVLVRRSCERERNNLLLNISSQFFPETHPQNPNQKISAFTINSRQAQIQSPSQKNTYQPFDQVAKSMPWLAAFATTKSHHVDDIPIITDVYNRIQSGEKAIDIVKDILKIKTSLANHLYDMPVPALQGSDDKPMIGKLRLLDTIPEPKCIDPTRKGIEQAIHLAELGETYKKITTSPEPFYAAKDFKVAMKNAADIQPDDIHKYHLFLQNKISLPGLWQVGARTSTNVDQISIEASHKAKEHKPLDGFSFMQILKQTKKFKQDEGALRKKVKDLSLNTTWTGMDVTIPPQNGYVVTQITSQKQLNDLDATFQNCLPGYGNKIIKKECLIFIISKDNKPVSALSIKGVNDDLLQGFTEQQHLGPHNKTVDQKTAQFGQYVIQTVQAQAFQDNQKILLRYMQNTSTKVPPRAAASTNEFTENLIQMQAEYDFTNPQTVQARFNDIKPYLPVSTTHRKATAQQWVQSQPPSYEEHRRRTGPTR